MDNVRLAEAEKADESRPANMFRTRTAVFSIRDFLKPGQRA
jgi:hypothetical protein